MNALPLSIYVSFAGALLTLAAGARSPSLARWVALATALIAWVIVLVAAAQFVPAPGLQDLVDLPWIAELGIRYHLAVDGISLTVFNLTDDTFEVAVIPHTSEVTTLGHRKPGHKVNIEIDVLAKHVERLLEHRN